MRGTPSTPGIPTRPRALFGLHRGLGHSSRCADSLDAAMVVRTDQPSTGPPWGHDPSDAGPLRADTRVDACIVGAGIAGACVAHELARQGLAVAVLDDGPIAGGETGRSTAHVTCALDDRFYALERAHGLATVRLAAQSHAAAI